MTVTPDSIAAEAGSAEVIDPGEFRAAAGMFLTGVTLVTTRDQDGTPRGVTANSFTTVSLDPPLVLVCIGKGSRSYPAFATCGTFAVNVLSSEQKELSRTFASKVEDKFAGSRWDAGCGGSPIVPEALASFDCVVHERIHAGDHVVLLGRVVGLRKATGTPLGYFSGNYVDFGAQREMAASARTRFGGLFRHGGALLFLVDQGRLCLPFADTLTGEEGGHTSLLGTLADLGIHASLSFVYAVYNDESDGGLHTVYLGEIEEIRRLDLDRFVLLQPDEIPYERLGMLAGLVRRYERERAQDTFGLYVGTSSRGNIHRMPAPQKA